MGNDILAAIGAESAPILIKLNEYEGRHSLEIRRYYYARPSRELRPTQKGINLNQEAFAILRERYPQLRLTLRTALPALDEHYHRIIEQGWVRVVNRFLAAGPEGPEAWGLNPTRIGAGA